MVLFSRDSSRAAASSAALVSVDESRYTIILAARTEKSGSPEYHFLSSFLQFNRYFHPVGESFELHARVCGSYRPVGAVWSWGAW